MNPNDELIDLTERLSDAVKVEDVTLIKGCFKDFESIDADECDMDELEYYNEMAELGAEVMEALGFNPIK